MSRSTSLNTGVPARDIQYGVVQGITRTVAYNTPGIDTADTVTLGTLPSGAQILNCTVRVKTAFNAATTNVLTVGTASGSNADIVSSADVAEGTTGAYVADRGADVSITADTQVYVKYTQTGTAATAGEAVITLTYLATSNG